MVTRLAFVAALLLALSVPARSGHAQTILGVVREDPSRQPVEGATISLLDSLGAKLGETVSDADGRFAVGVPALGTYRLAVSRIGYAPTTSELFLVGPDDELSAEIQLTVQPVLLRPLEVVGEPRLPHLERVGFYKRMEKGWGHFILSEEIDRASAVWATDLLLGLPRRGRGRPGCSGGRTIALDGVVLSDGNFNEVVHPSEIEAIEVYPSPHGVPVQYRGLGRSCGAILIWTRR